MSHHPAMSDDGRIGCPGEGSLTSELAYWLGRSDVRVDNTSVITVQHGTGESYLNEAAWKLRDCIIMDRHS